MQFDWSTQLDILALVGRWASPNIPQVRCTHCTRGILTQVELRKCCLGQSEKSKIPHHLTKCCIENKSPDHGQNSQH